MKKTLFLTAILGTALCSTAFAEGTLDVTESATYTADQLNGYDTVNVEAGVTLSSSLSGVINPTVVLKEGAAINNSNTGAWGDSQGVKVLTLNADAGIKSGGGFDVADSLNLNGHKLTISTDRSAGGVYIKGDIDAGTLETTKGATQINKVHTTDDGAVNLIVNSGSTLRLAQNFAANKLSGNGTLMSSDRSTTLTLNSTEAQTFSGAINSDGNRSDRTFTLKNDGSGLLTFSGSVGGNTTLEGVVDSATSTSNVLFTAQYGAGNGTLKNVQIKALNANAGNSSITLDGVVGYFAQNSTQRNLTLTGNGMTQTDGYGGSTLTFQKFAGAGKYEKTFGGEMTYTIQDATTWTGKFINSNGTANVTFEGNSNADIDAKGDTNVTLKGTDYSGMVITAYNNKTATVTVSNSADTTLQQFIQDPWQQTQGHAKLVLDNGHKTTITDWATVDSVTMKNGSSVTLNTHNIGTLKMESGSGTVDSGAAIGSDIQHKITNIELGNSATLTLAKAATVQTVTGGENSDLLVTGDLTVTGASVIPNLTVTEDATIMLNNHLVNQLTIEAGKNVNYFSNKGIGSDTDHLTSLVTVGGNAALTFAAADTSVGTLSLCGGSTVTVGDQGNHDYTLATNGLSVMGFGDRINADLVVNAGGTLTFGTQAAILTMGCDVTIGSADGAAVTVNIKCNDADIAAIESGTGKVLINGLTAADMVTLGNANIYVNGALNSNYQLARSEDGASIVVIVPEPATATLSLLALAGLCARRRRH